MVLCHKKEVAGQRQAQGDCAVGCLGDSDRVSGVGYVVGAKAVGGVGEISVVSGHGHRRGIAAVVGATDADQGDLRKRGAGCAERERAEGDYQYAHNGIHSSEDLSRWRVEGNLQSSVLLD